MKLPLIAKLRHEDFKDAPDWLDRVFLVLNQFMDAIYGGLKNNITFQDNIACNIKTVSIDMSNGVFSTTSFSHSLKSKPIGVLLMQIQDTKTNRTITDPVSLQWSQSNGIISIDYIAGLTVGKTYSVTVLVI